MKLAQNIQEHIVESSKGKAICLKLRSKNRLFIPIKGEATEYEMIVSNRGTELLVPSQSDAKLLLYLDGDSMRTYKSDKWAVPFKKFLRAQQKEFADANKGTTIIVSADTLIVKVEVGNENILQETAQKALVEVANYPLAMYPDFIINGIRASISLNSFEMPGIIANSPELAKYVIWELNDVKDCQFQVVDVEVKPEILAENNGYFAVSVSKHELGSLPLFAELVWAHGRLPVQYL